MRAVRCLVALLMLFGIGTAALAAEVPIPATPSRWATDTASFLRVQTVSDLDSRLEAYERTTGHQVLVYVTPTTGATPTEDWTVRAFSRWKVGRKGLDDGLVLFVFPTDRKVRIEVGYGLEATLPDATTSRIIRDTITPEIRAGASDDAIVAGVGAILAAIGGETTAVASAAPRPESIAEPTSDESDDASPLGVAIGIFSAILICVLIVVVIGRLPRSRGTYISHRSGFGFWDVASIVGGGLLGGGGGGFSGGGGSSGGGGATGSW